MAFQHKPTGHGKLKPGNLTSLPHNAAGPAPMPATQGTMPLPAGLPATPAPALVRQDPGMIQ